MILSDAAIKNRTTVLVLIILIIVSGLYSYVALPREAEPEVPIPFVIVSTQYEGISPEDVETAVTMKIEKELQGLKCLEEIKSSSAEGISLITIEFTPDIDIEDALQRVRDKVDRARGELPREIEEPMIREINVSDFPVLVMNLYGPVSLVHLKEIAEDLEDIFEAIPGVLDATVSGGLEREIRLEFDPDRLVAYKISLAELISLIPSENVNISSGNVESAEAKFSVRVPGEFVRPDEVDHLLLTVREGKPIYLSDVAKVRDTFKDREGYSRINGQECVTLSIQKRTGANIIEIVDRIKAVMAKAQSHLPTGVSYTFTLDDSKDIRRMVSELENSILSGLILVVGVLFVFLGWRTSLIVGFAIPLSMLISFGILLAMGYTLNIVVLFSLTLALGMLVDNAIVITENIYRHHQEGKPLVQAGMDGTAEVAWPVITSTATTLAAFAPMMFWPGIIGEFMSFLPITLIITLSASLFVALVITPMLSTVLIRLKAEHRAGVTEGPFLRRYRAVLELALAHRPTTLILAVMVLVGLTIGYVRHGHGVEFFPEVDPQRAYIDLRGAQGTALSESDRRARMIEDVLVDYYGDNKDRDLRNYVASVGAGSESGARSLQVGTSGSHRSRINLDFHDYQDRRRHSAQALMEIRSKLPKLTGVEVRVKKSEHGPPRGEPVTVEIAGEDFKVLTRLSDEVQRRIIDVPGLVNLREDYERAKPELQFIVDRQRAMLLSVNTQVIGEFLKTAFWGRKVSTYRQYDDEYDITVRLPRADRLRIEDLYRLQVPNLAGRPVPLSSLGEFVYTGGKGTIERIDQKRVITVLAEAEGRLGNDVLADVQKRLSELDLPPGYTIKYAGETEKQDESSAFLEKAFIAALLLITLILVAQFNSLRIPFIVMTTVILSLIGVLVGLLVFKMPFGVVMTGVGVISLAGVVVNNAIVLLDYTRQLQDRGMTLVQASVQAGMTRLRPVLLTAITTVLGLIPMAAGISFNFRQLRWEFGSESAEWWGSMAIAVIFGLTFATILTLVVVPTLYCMLHQRGERLAAERRAAEAGETCLP
ncbi:MAG: efflux RND transporter permease subunit [Phycisphaerae bacterium]|nr:efflux RND transporter permease subunit [Phycisphaerae bacterium]